MLATGKAFLRRQTKEVPRRPAIPACHSERQRRIFSPFRILRLRCAPLRMTALSKNVPGGSLFRFAAFADPGPASRRPAIGAAAEIPGRLLLPQAAAARFSALPLLPIPGLLRDGPPSARLQRFRAAFFCHRQRRLAIPRRFWKEDAFRERKNTESSPPACRFFC